VLSEDREWYTGTDDMVSVVMVFAGMRFSSVRSGSSKFIKCFLTATPTIMPFRKADRSSSRIVLRTRQIKRNEQGKKFHSNGKLLGTGPGLLP
jgi:hypothetical protein